MGLIRHNICWSIDAQINDVEYVNSNKTKKLGRNTYETRKKHWQQNRDMYCFNLKFDKTYNNAVMAEKNK